MSPQPQFKDTPDLHSSVNGLSLRKNSHVGRQSRFNNAICQ